MSAASLIKHVSELTSQFKSRTKGEVEEEEGKRGRGDECLCCVTAYVSFPTFIDNRRETIRNEGSGFAVALMLLRRRAGWCESRSGFMFLYVPLPSFTPLYSPLPSFTILYPL